MAVFFFGIGGAVLTKRKPLIVSSRWFFSFMVLAFAPTIVGSVLLLIEQFTQDTVQFRDIWMLLLNPLVFSVLLLFFWIQMQGYMFLGITDETIRDALHYGLQELKSPYEEILTKIVLSELNTELQISVQSWMGTGQIKIKNRSKKAFLAKLVLRMRMYFEEHDIPTKKITAIFYLIMGGFMTLFAIGMFFLGRAMELS
jgi:hypothetical protein